MNININYRKDNDWYLIMIDTVKKGRLEWIDFAKGIGIYLLVLGHMPSLPSLFTNWIYSFHMPLFFFLSGYVFKESRSYKETIKKSFKNLIVPYLCYDLIFLLADILFWGIRSKIVQEDISNIKCGQGSCGVIWFLLAMFWVQLIFGLLSRINVEWVKNSIIVLLVILGYSLSLLLQHELYKIVTAMVALGFFTIGNYIKKVNFNCRANSLFLFIIMLSTSVFLSVLSYKLYGTRIEMSGAIYNNIIITYINALAGIFIAVKFSIFYVKYAKLNKNVIFQNFNKITQYIGKNSLYFFPLTAYIPVRIVDLLSYYFNVNFIMKIISKIIGFVATYFIVELLKKIRTNKLSKLHMNN